MDRALYVSASALSNYHECPRKFFLSRVWRPVGLERPRYFQVGWEAHALLSGEITEEAADADAVAAAKALSALEKQLMLVPADAVAAAKALSALEKQLMLVPLERELWQQFSLAGTETVDGRRLGDVVLSRRVDMVARDAAGHEVLVDYKTAGNPWEVVLWEVDDDDYKTAGNPWEVVLWEVDDDAVWVAPMAYGVQSVLYLLPPPDRQFWPRKIVYLVYSFRRRKSQVFDYKGSEEDLQRVLCEIADIEEQWREGEQAFRKHVGYPCTRCAWAGKCWSPEASAEFYEPMVLEDGVVEEDDG